MHALHKWIRSKYIKETLNLIITLFLWLQKPKTVHFNISIIPILYFNQNQLDNIK